MKNKMKWLYLAGGILGGALILVGGFVLTGESVKALSGTCIGFGAAGFALGIGSFFDEMLRSSAKREEIERVKKIEVEDERNTLIRQKVGATTNHILVYVISTMLLVMSFMGESLGPILLMASLLVVQFILAVALTAYYSKRL